MSMPSWFNVGNGIGVTGIVVGALISYFFYRKQKIGSRLYFQMAYLEIIGKIPLNTPEQIEVLYGGTKVERLIKTQVVCWNSGTAMVDGKNIVGHDPLRFEFSKGVEVLSAEVINRSNDVNLFDVNIQENSIFFDFDFLNPKDGAIIEILHTDREIYPTVNGTIKGVMNKNTRINNVDYPLIVAKDKKSIVRLVRNFTFYFLLFGITVGIVSFANPDKNLLDMKPHLIDYMALATLVPSFFLFFYTFKNRRKKFPKTIK